MNKLILVGGGGHCRSCIDVIEAEGKYSIAGIVDIKGKIGEKILHYQVIACDEELDQIVKEFNFCLITLGQIKSPKDRVRLFNKIKQLGACLPVITSPRAQISEYAVLGEGSIVMHNAVVNANALIGNNCIINTGAIVEHDTFIGNHCHISTSSIVNGSCKISGGVTIGSNSTIIQGVSIAKGTVVGAGSVVIKDIEQSGVYTGCPAHMIDKS